MNVTCYIRRTKKWAEQYEFSDIYDDFWKASHIAKVWNETFNIDYINFRKQLGLIQQENIREVAFDNIVNQYDYVGNNSTIVVPTDDDDWYHPDVVFILREHCKPVMFWNFLNYNQGAITLYDSLHKPELFQFESNNYAVIKPDENVLKDHVVADQKLRNKGFYIDACLSMHNRSLASLSLLKPLLSGDFKSELLRLYDKYRQQPTGDVPSYFCKYIDKMLKIYREELKVSKVFF